MYPLRRILGRGRLIQYWRGHSVDLPPELLESLDVDEYAMASRLRWVTQWEGYRGRRVYVGSTLDNRTIYSCAWSTWVKAHVNTCYPTLIKRVKEVVAMDGPASE